MATEITCVRCHCLHPEHIEAVGGPGWSADLATVLGEIAAGRQYTVRRGEVSLPVGRVTLHGRDTIATEGAENLLLSLPPCPSAARAGSESSP